ncbi:glutathione S-transferase family protein [Ferrimonas marina]|uniref:Glutathione S-transferase n=1 Tax=Ferrimonas marina TaxID=299255 RepID=A0A1M5MJU2_9GAMM|nr:glutathione binding-like protein [Ferrimonas marina]SHG77548.1 glutathione S-transferase [Ferrimonas marina]
MSSNNDIVLYTASTMNGWKPVIFLEEAGVDYDLVPIDFSKREQKAPEYLKLNPNGRIPTIVDRSNDDFVVFESGAILWYLAQKYGKFLPSDPKAQSETLQWLMFQMGGIGPMMGQAMYFQRIAAKQGEEHPFAIKRYVDESRRLLEVLNTRLEGRQYLVNEEFTIADIATYPWARAFYWANVSVEGLPHLQAWFDRIDGREATQRALTIPKPFWAFFGRGDVAAQERENADRFKTDVRKDNE